MYYYLNLCSKLNFYKIWNAAKVFLSFLISRINKKSIIWGLPWGLSIEPTTSCNLRCTQCPSGLRSFTRPTGMIDIDLFEKIINENKKHLIHLNLYFQGEPYLHQGIYKMLEICKKNKIFTSTSTNGHYIDTTSAEKTIKAGLDKIIISLDGTTQESYEKYRVGGKLEKVLLAIDCFSKAKQKLKSSIKIVVQFIVFKYNEYEIEDVKKYIKKYKNVDLQIKTAQIYDFEKAKELLPIQTKFSRYKMDANNMPILKNKFENECWRMWHSAVVTWDGKMLPCCFDKDAKYEFGNIRKEKLDTIWNSEKYHYFRTKILSNRKEIDICQNCTEGSQVFA